MRKILLLTGLFISFGLFAAGSREIVRHRIQPRETIFRISLMYNSTVHDIVRANPGINPKILAEGALIKVPKNTKIRDAAFVESFLNGQVEISQASREKTDKPLLKKANIETPARIVAPAQAEIKEEKPGPTKKEIIEVPTSPETEIKVDKSAAIKVNIIEAPLHAQAEDENPFLTPAEPRSGPSASDEQPIREEKISEPASADKGVDSGEENPFMAPKHKTEAKKSTGKAGSGATSSTPE